MFQECDRIYGVVKEVKDSLHIVHTSYGIIQEMFQRERLFVVENITPTSLGVKNWLERSVSLRYILSQQEGPTSMFCRCKGDCSKTVRCSCRSAGLACTINCHGGNGKNRSCCLILPLQRKRKLEIKLPDNT